MNYFYGRTRSNALVVAHAHICDYERFECDFIFIMIAVII